jgi:acetyl-CoA acyltransferase 1|tara:strand:+ start:21 stop:1307 length:1287 start_codon:yes stop_codon:yes gene_type:complete
MSSSSSANRRLQNLTKQMSAPITPSPTAAFTKSMDDVVIVSALRTAIGKARKGSFKNTTPDTLLSGILKATIERTGIDPLVLGDIAVGNVQMSGSYAGPARMAQFSAGLPYEVPLSTVNRQCSSGLQAVANIANAISSGQIDAGIGAGVESMSVGGGVGGGAAEMMATVNASELFNNDLARQSLTPMGITSENVAERYGITRLEQDQMAMDSHRKALRAQELGYFNSEIVPITTTVETADGEEKTIVVDKDDGPRKGTTMEGLARLKPAFKKGGSTTAGNASQVSDGASAVLLMRRSKAIELGMPILGAYRGFQVVGVQPDEMGIGPAAAIPAALKAAGLTTNDIDIFEINEAFASQAAYCVKKLGIPMEKVNPNGGAISLGHPLGNTGSRMVATLMAELKRTKKKLGVVSMCIGTGMGACGIFECEA